MILGYRFLELLDFVIYPVLVFMGFGYRRSGSAALLVGGLQALWPIDLTFWHQ